MAWTTPRTWTTGEVLTAANLNTHLRDNLTFLGASHDHSGDSGDGADLSTSITALLDDAASNYSWVGIDFTQGGNSATDGERMGFGFAASLASSGAMLQATDPTGGGAKITTGTTAGGEFSVKTMPAWEGARSPKYRCRLASEAGAAAIDVQAWGFWVGGDVRDADTVANTKACFRSETTGNLFAVTSNGSSEETTDLSGSHTTGAEATFIVQTTDSGSTWTFLIGGTTRATHSTTVPGTTTILEASIGIQTNATTNLELDNVDYVYVNQTRD